MADKPLNEEPDEPKQSEVTEVYQFEMNKVYRKLLFDLATPISIMNMLYEANGIL